MLLILIVIGTIGIILSNGLSAGNHGSIKGYQYDVPKETLETAIFEVVSENKILTRPAMESLISYDSDNNYFNSNMYITLTIAAPEKYNYI